MSPAQAGESREVTISRDELASMFDGECCDVGIAHHCSLDSGPLDGVNHDFPMTRTWFEKGGSRSCDQLAAKRDGHFHRCGGIEDAGIRDNAKEPTQGEG